MKRWLVNIAEKEMLYYSEAVEEIYKLFPEATSVVPYDNTEHIEIIENIKQLSEFVGHDYRNREIYKLPHYNKYILVKFSCDEDGNYYDFCEFQRWDCYGLIRPTLWTLSNPKYFYDTFCKNISTITKAEFISSKELKKIKPIKFYNKNNQIYWIDNNGYFYQAEKFSMPNKKNKELHKRFVDNKDAVLGCYKIASRSNPHATEEVEWFDSVEAFKQFCKEKIAECPTYCGTPYYHIKKFGYTKSQPDDRKVIARLPYFDLETELKIGTSDSEIIKTWVGLFEKNVRTEVATFNLIENILKQYKEYRQKENAK